MITKQFREKMEQLNGHIYELDLSKEEEKEYYLESIGGEEKLSQLPIMYQSFQNACRPSAQEQLVKEQLAENKEPDDIKFEFYDLIFENSNKSADNQGKAGCKESADHFILKTNYVGHFLDLKSPLQDLTPPRPRNVCIYGEVYDPKSAMGALIEMNDSFDAANDVVMECKSDVYYSIEELGGRTLIQKAVLTVIDEDSKFHSYVISQQNEAIDAYEIPFSNIELEMPVSNNHTDEIRILYGRSAVNLDHPDYIYSSNHTSQGFLRTIVPMKFHATFKTNEDGSYYSFEGLHKVESWETMTRPVLSVDGKDWKKFRNDLKSDEEFYQAYNKDAFFHVVKENEIDHRLEVDLYHPDLKKGDDRHDMIG